MYKVVDVFVVVVCRAAVIRAAVRASCRGLRLEVDPPVVLTSPPPPTPHTPTCWGTDQVMMKRGSTIGRIRLSSCDPAISRQLIDPSDGCRVCAICIVFIQEMSA